LYHDPEFTKTRAEFGPKVGGWGVSESKEYRGTSLIRNSADLGPYIRAIPRVLWWS